MSTTNTTNPAETGHFAFEHDDCVRCEIGDTAAHDHTPIVSRHEADGAPSSEICSGLDECPDCLDVLAQNAQALPEGVSYNSDRRFTMLIGPNSTFSVIEDTP